MTRVMTRAMTRTLSISHGESPDTLASKPSIYFKIFININRLLNSHNLVITKYFRLSFSVNLPGIHTSGKPVRRIDNRCDKFAVCFHPLC